MLLASTARKLKSKPVLKEAGATPLLNCLVRMKAVKSKSISKGKVNSTPTHDCCHFFRRQTRLFLTYGVLRFSLRYVITANPIDFKQPMR